MPAKNAVVISVEQQNSAIRRSSPQADVAHSYDLTTAGGLNLILSLVADGDSLGDASGAARLAVEKVVESVRRARQRSIPDILRNAFQSASAAFSSEQYGNRDLAVCTVGLTVAAVHNGRLHLAHSGSTRAYLVRGENVIRLTEDRMIGLPVESTPSTSFQNPANLAGEKIESLPLKPGDHVILCSDGLYASSKPDHFESALVRACDEPTVTQMAKYLITIPMSMNEEGNMSVLVMRVPRPLQSKHIVLVGGIVVGLLLSLIVGAALLKKPAGPPPTPMVVDTGVAIMESSTAPVERLLPGQSKGERISNIAEFPAGYGLRTSLGVAKLLVAGTHVYIGPSSEVVFDQIEPQGGLRTGQVVLTLVRGQLLVRRDQPGRPFNVQINENIFGVIEGEKIGILGNTVQGNLIAVDCLEGICAYEVNGEKRPIEVQMRIRFIDSVPSLVEILPDLYQSWNILCGNCMP